MKGIFVGLEIATDLDLHEVEFVSDSTEAVWSVTTGVGANLNLSMNNSVEISAITNNRGWTSSYIQGIESRCA